MFGEQLAGDRAVEQVALTNVAALAAQVAKLRGRFHALGHDLQAQIVGHGDHRRSDLHVVLAVRNVLDEAAVDLDDIDREFLQVAQRRVAGPEIIHGKRQAQCLQADELLPCFLGGGQQQPFGELELELAGRQLFLAQDGRDGSDQIGGRRTAWARG